MTSSRRHFLKTTLAGSAALGLAPLAAQAAGAEAGKPVSPEWYGCLVDLSLCVGCRKCEAACNEVNAQPPPAKPFNDLTVLEQPRRPDETAFTVVNKYIPEKDKEPVFVKVQCMHCNDPACVSACIVGALTKSEKGAAVYDAGKCLGCRYCMVACPFQIPAYEYANPITPRVRKCGFCAERFAREGKAPGCVLACPKEALIFGKRQELLELARRKIATQGSEFRPHATYVNHVYGEKEVGGTSWIYISAVPFEKLGFLSLPEQAPPRLTETIQHGIFKQFVAPITLFGLLGVAMRVFDERRNAADAEKAEKKERKDAP